MAKDPDAGLFSWVFLGTMMGPAIVFTIPVALGIIEKQDHPYFAKGILIGLCTVPIGCFAGGLAAGFEMGLILKNILIPSLFLRLSLLDFGAAPTRQSAYFTFSGRLSVLLRSLGLLLSQLKQ